MSGNNNSSTKQTREVYRAREVAHKLGISQEQVLRHLRSGRIPGVKLGRSWLIPAAELQRILSIKDHFDSSAL